MKVLFPTLDLGSDLHSQPLRLLKYLVLWHSGPSRAEARRDAIWERGACRDQAPSGAWRTCLGKSRAFPSLPGSQWALCPTLGLELAGLGKMEGTTGLPVQILVQTRMLSRAKAEDPQGLAAAPRGRV